MCACDREFCSVKLASWLSHKGISFCLRQKGDTFIQEKNGLYKELREWGLTPGMKLFIKDRQVTQQTGFGTFNIAAKWKAMQRGLGEAARSWGSPPETKPVYCGAFIVSRLCRKGLNVF